MRKTFVVGLALTFTNADSAISRPALRARWSATDGFSDASFCSFNAARYQGMVEDEERTTMFAEAIRDALRRRPGAVVLVSLVLGSTANPNPVTKALIVGRCHLARVHSGPLLTRGRGFDS